MELLTVGETVAMSWAHGEVVAVSSDEAIVTVRLEGARYFVTGMAAGEASLELSTVPGTEGEAAAIADPPVDNAAAHATQAFTVSAP